MTLADSYSRPLRNLRLSVTDRCNLRCEYCMPEEEYTWLPHDDILTFEEMSQLVDVFLDLGVDKVRLTGGEPLLRKELPNLVEQLAAKPAIRDLALTTNGILLDRQARALKNAGLHRLTISLDTLNPALFKELARRDALQQVLRGIDSALSAGFENLKIDTVVIKGTNDDRLTEMLEYGRDIGAEVRFIEYMDVGGATHWSLDRVMPRADMLESLAVHYGPIQPVQEVTSAPADRYTLPDGTVFGIISSTTQPFCGSCDRSRLTADGHWFTCLYAAQGMDLRAPLRRGASAADLSALISATWRKRTDRGAEMRLALEKRKPAPALELKGNPHLEMHTRGG